MIHLLMFLSPSFIRKFNRSNMKYKYKRNNQNIHLLSRKYLPDKICISWKRISGRQKFWKVVYVHVTNNLMRICQVSLLECLVITESKNRKILI